MQKKSRMYAATATWNPFRGCRFNCTYCGPSFRRQAKRRKQTCMDCYDYVPHYHFLVQQGATGQSVQWVPRSSKSSPCGIVSEWKLSSIPSAQTVFVCGFADMSFCDPQFTFKIIEAINKHNTRCPDKVYYLQSKKPVYFEEFLQDIPDNVFLLTTLETNRDIGYGKHSNAPPPSERYRQFLNLTYPRKVITIEPLMDFDVEVFPQWIVDLAPQYVWLGYNSRPKTIQLPEPSPGKLRELVAALASAGVPIRPKDLRGVYLGIPTA